MKKLILLFAFILFIATAQSQSLTEKDVTGTWVVVNVENSTANPKMAAAMTKAVINLYADNSFEIKEKQADANPYSFKTTTNKNARWTYNPSTQTVSTTGAKMTFTISKNGDKTFFTDKDSGLKLEVMMPM